MNDVPLIIGGGPAGAAASIHLARAGQAPTLLERTTGPTDKVCGDFLSTEAVAALQELGLDLRALGAAPIDRLRVLCGKRLVETRLPFAAMGLARRVLDEALLDQAAVHGVRVRRGQAVRGMTVTHTGLTLRTDRADIRARTIFLATGKHDLRGAARPVHGAGPIGLKTYLRLMPEQRSELGGHVELILFPGGYAGLQPVEGDAAVLCTIVDRTRFAAVGGTWQALLNDLMAGCPHLAARLAGSIGLRDRPVAVAGIPYGHLHRSKPDDPPGVFRLGDQACVIPSLTGDGVAIALHSARLAVQTWSRGGDAIDHHRRLANSLRLQMTIAGVAHRLCLGPAQAWIAALGQASPAMLRWVAAWTRLHAPPKVPRSAH